MDISKLNLEQIKKIIKKAKNILVQSSQKIDDKTARLVFSVDIDNDQLEAVLNQKDKIKKGNLMTAKEFQEILSKNNDHVLKQTKSMIESNIKPINERLDKIEGRLDGIEGRLTNIEKDIETMKNTPTMRKELR